MRAPSPLHVAAALALLALTPGLRADAARKGRILPGGGLSPEGVVWHERRLDDRLDALDYPAGAVNRFERWEGGPGLQLPDHLREHMETTHYDRMIKQYFDPEPENKQQPGFAFARSLMGVTGLITLPDSYVLPAGTWAVGTSLESQEYGPNHWSELYQSQDNFLTKVYVNRGFEGDFEGGLILRLENSDITYVPQAPNTMPPNFTQDRVFGGLSFKAHIPAHGFLMTAGFAAELIDDSDRHHMDLRAYDTQAAAFITFGARGRRWDGSVVAKYVKYAFGGRRPPVGANGLQPGFSPTPDWTQLGVAMEYDLFKGFSILGEATARHTVNFVGIPEAEVNLGFEYEVDDLSARVFGRRLNTRDADHYGAAVTLRFD